MNLSKILRWSSLLSAVRVSDLGLEPDCPGGRVDRINNLGQQPGHLLVAGFAGERDRPAQPGGRGLIVTRPAGLGPDLNGLGELGLACVTRDMAADRQEQRLVIGPDRSGNPLPSACGPMPC